MKRSIAILITLFTFCITLPNIAVGVVYQPDLYTYPGFEQYLKPDLIVQNIEAPHSYFFVSQYRWQTFINVEIKNIGSRVTIFGTRALLRDFDNGTTISAYVKPLAAGESTIITFSLPYFVLWPDCTGIHIFADGYNQIIESDETNNTMCLCYID